MVSFISEISVIYWLCWLMIVSALFMVVSLMLGMRATYGRYTVQSTIALPARIAWVTQELPSLIVPLYYIVDCQNISGFIVLTAFIVHYFNRSFIYSLQIKSENYTPWFIYISALIFCTLNGYLQGAYHSKYYAPQGFFSSFSTYFGVLLFVTGMFINIHSDSILKNLRKPGESDYKIPRAKKVVSVCSSIGFLMASMMWWPGFSGMFEYVSGANFFGEIVEWTGYAIMSGSLPAISFAILTASNIGPRAIHHHQWYLNKFPEYPRQRKAVIPFLL